jgi:exosome complex RNA-binding protein Csl4
MRSVVDAVLESWDGATNNAKGASAVVGIVLGVSMATTNVRMVLVEGENADGVTVDQDDLDVAADSSASAATQA